MSNEDVNANADTHAANADAGASGVVTGVAQGESTGATFTEQGHQANSDVNTQELISTVNGSLAVAVNALRVVNDNMSQSFKQAMDTVAIMGAQSAQTTQDMVAKQAIRHSDLAIDREWNVNESDIAASAVLERLVERLNNPTPAAVK